MATYTETASRILDDLHREAITRACVRGIATASPLYHLDGGVVCVSATYDRGHIRARLTVRNKAATWDEAVEAIAARMQSRMG